MKQLLKILSLVFIFLSFAGNIAFAQVDEEDNPLTDDDYEFYKEKFNLKEKVFIGGGINFGFTDEQLNFGITPFVGLRLTDHLHVATGINYSYIGVRLPVTTGERYEAKFNLLDYRIFARYLLINFETIGRGIKREAGDPLGGIYAHVEYSKNILNSKKENFPVPQIDVQVPDQSFFVGAGYQQNFYRGFGYFAEIVYNVIQEENENGWPIDIRIGLYYGF